MQSEKNSPPPRPPPPGTSTSQTTESTLVPHIWSFKDLQKVHDTAYRLIDIGLQADERGDVQVATTNYTEGLHLMDKALRVNCEQLSHSTVDQIAQAKQLLQKMNKTRQQISFRLQELQATNTHGQQILTEPTTPPSYEEATSEPPSLPPSYEDDELTALGESLMRREISNSHLANAEELFSVDDGVQIFYITAEGYVSAPTYPSSLHIVRFINEPLAQGPNGEEIALFLHVGDWVYPLIPGASPAYYTNYGAYLFPDVTASQPGAAVGLLIPDTLPQDERQKFEDIIRSSTLYGEQSAPSSPTEERPVPSAVTEKTRGQEAKEEGEGKEEEEPLDTAGKISKGIQIAAEWIAWGVTVGAEKAEMLIKKGSEKFQQKYKPADHVHKVDPKVQKGVIYARQATHGAVKVTGYIVNKLGELTVAIAKELAPTVRKQGMKIVPKSMKSENSQGKSTVDGVVQVAATGLKGFGTVYMGLEAAAKSLGRCLVDETGHIITHKYGEDAGCLAENSMYAAGNVFMTAHNASHLGVKAIAKRAAKETGKAVIKDIHENKTKKDSTAQCENSPSGSKDKTGPSCSHTDKKQPPNGGH